MQSQTVHWSHPLLVCLQLEPRELWNENWRNIHTQLLLQSWKYFWKQWKGQTISLVSPSIGWHRGLTRLLASKELAAAACLKAEDKNGTELWEREVKRFPNDTNIHGWSFWQGCMEWVERELSCLRCWYGCSAPLSRCQTAISAPNMSPNMSLLRAVAHLV